MNIFSYIDRYSNFTFEEKEFNEIDNIIFSSLSYIDLENYVSPNATNKKKIGDVGERYISNYSKKEKKILAKKNAIKVLRYIKDTIRYKDLLLYNYCYIGDSEQQFSALTIEVNKKLVYISYEGTDQLISGWKEDFMMAYKFPVLSQKHAIDYINSKFTLSNKKIILGGHSKGGNLALVAGMYSNYFVRKRIINIYNNDGPGLIKDQFESKNYQNIIDKLIHIVPNYSVFGLLLRHTDNYIVIRSTRKSIYAHDYTSWVTDNNKFQRSELSTYSQIVESGVLKWLNKYNYEKREKFVGSLFKIFDELKIVSLIDLYSNKKLIFNLILKSRYIDEETKKMLKDFVHIILKNIKDVKIEELQLLIGNNK